MVQSAANHSRACNSLISRENTGNFADQVRLRHKCWLKSRHTYCILSRNSLRIVTGNFERRSGKGNSLMPLLSGNRVAIHSKSGLSLWIGEPDLAPGANGARRSGPGPASILPGHSRADQSGKRRLSVSLGFFSLFSPVRAGEVITKTRPPTSISQVT
jgi:hypothetical protein